MDTDGDGQIDQYGFGMRGGNGGHYMWESFVLSAEADKDLYDSDGVARLADGELNILENQSPAPLSLRAGAIFLCSF